MGRRRRLLWWVSGPVGEAWLLVTIRAGRKVWLLLLLLGCWSERITTWIGILLLLLLWVTPCIGVLLLLVWWGRRIITVWSLLVVARLLLPVG